MITLSIDVLQLDKSRFKEFRKQNGQLAKYCELVLIETPDGKYGDYMVKQSCTKEERAAKVQMPILGNGKKWDKGSAPTPASKSKPAGDEPPPEDDEVPF